MKLEPGHPFEPWNVDAVRYAEFGAPLYVIAPPAEPTLMGWSWETHGSVPIFGEAGYLTEAGVPLRVRTWASLPEGAHAAIAAHSADLIANAEAGTSALHGEHDATVVVSGRPVPARAWALGRFQFVALTLASRLVTVAHPATSDPPALTTLDRWPQRE